MRNEDEEWQWGICWWHQTERFCWLCTGPGTLERLEICSVSHGMKFNTKCWILHLEQSNAGLNIHWEKSAQTVGPFQWKYYIFLFYFLKLWITLERGQSCLIVAHTGKARWGSEGICCAAIVKKGRRILSGMDFWWNLFQTSDEMLADFIPCKAHGVST